MTSRARHEIWLFRHGETAWTLTGQHTGRTDLPLNNIGRRQAEALGRALANRSFATVLCSPLIRAVETCRLAGYGETARITDDLKEWDYGAYEGLRLEEILEKRPGWTIWNDGAPGGETVEQIAGRLLDQRRACVTRFSMCVPARTGSRSATRRRTAFRDLARRLAFQGPPRA